MKKLLIFAFTVLSLFLFPGHSVSGQVNPSFETGTNPGGFSTVFAGQTNISGWSVDFGSVDYIGSYWQASHGGRSIDLNGNGQRGQISQHLPTVAGLTYKVTFDMSGNPDGNPVSKAMVVSVDNDSAALVYRYVIGSNTRANMLWEPETYCFTAESPVTLLTFTSLVQGFYGPAIDNVTVTVDTQACP